MRRQFAIVAALLAAAIGLLRAGAAETPPLSATPLFTDSIAVESGTIKSADGRLSLIVELADPPVAKYEGGVAGLEAPKRQSAGRAKIDFRSAEAQAYAAYLERRQADFIAAMAAEAPGATADKRFQTVFNGLSVWASAKDAEAIRRMPQVKAVYPNQIMHANMDASLPLIGAPEFWNDLGGQGAAGDGIFIAVVDTGIRPENPLFDGTGYTAPPGFPPAGSDGAIYPEFFTGKLIVARHATPDITVHDDEFTTSALDYHGHGTHTAGTAAGNANVQADIGDGIVETISGVAPRAFLGAYKGLYSTPSGGGSGTDAMLLNMFDQAVADGADIITNSWGGDYGSHPSASPYLTAYNNAWDAGIVIIHSAGNNGPVPQTIGRPANHAKVFTVGNSTTNRCHMNTVDATGPDPVPAEMIGLGAMEGVGPKLTSDLGPAPILFAGDVHPGNELGCSPFPAGAFAGAVALIRRGSCNFITKVQNAENAGAIAVLVIKNQAGPPFSMGGLNAGETIPSFMMAQADGEALLAWMQANPGAQVRINSGASRVLNDEWQDLIASGSSRGPDGDPDILKPDIAAPGTNILSGNSPAQNGQNFAFMSGTSMAAPHVAGAAALVLQQHPGWTPEQVRTALTSTSKRPMTNEESLEQSSPFAMGAGRLDLGKARGAGATFSAPSMAEDACLGQCSWTRTITNELPVAAMWTASTMSDTPGFSLSVVPEQLTLNPGESAEFTVAADSRLAADNQWCFGWVMWSADGALAPDAVLPVAVWPVRTTNDSMLAKNVDLSSALAQDILTYTIDLTNSDVADRFILTDAIPANTTYVDGSATETIVGGTSVHTFAYDPIDNSMRWEGDLNPWAMSLSPTGDAYGYLALSDFSVPPANCSGVCDDTYIWWTGLDYYYLGQHYSDIIMSSNGFLIPGTDVAAAATPFNTELPNPLAPNGVIAPFWADLDMDGSDPGDSGGGIWRVAILTNGAKLWYVFEWDSVQEWGQPSSSYSFQVWIEVGTDKIWFVYGSLSGVPGYLTVGAENIPGTVGVMRYFDGTGTPPATGVDLELTGTAGGTAQFSFQAQAGNLPGIVINNADLATSNGLLTETAFAATNIDLLPSVVPNPGSLPFGNVDIDNGAAILTVEIGNGGTLPLVFGSPAFQVVGDADFAIANSPSTADLGRSESVLVDIAFDPASLGPKNAVLRVQSNDPVNPVFDIPLSGAGVQTQGAPILMNVSDNGDGSVSAWWANPNLLPSALLALVYDIYEDDYVVFDNLGAPAPFKSLDPAATSATLDLAYPGGYHLWVSNLYADLSWHVSNPWSGILYSGVPQPILDAAAQDLGGNTARLSWKPNLYGVWHYQIVIYKDGEGFITPTGPSSSKGFDPWTFIDYGGAAFDNTLASFAGGWADFGLTGPGQYTFYIRAVGWVPPFQASDFAAVALTLN